VYAVIFEVSGAGLEAGDGLVVVVVDDVGNLDGGCAGVISNDVADIAGVDRLVGGLIGLYASLAGAGEFG
jgi:hypothetical protein